MLADVRRILTPARYAETASGGAWKPYPHLEQLSRAIVDTVAGRDGIRRLLIGFPPQHGKSELTSKYTPAWFLSLWPEKRVILASYQAEFAASWGRKARDVFAEMSETTGLQVSKSLKRAEWWGIEGHQGSFASSGAGASITGKGADVFVIDDPFANAEEAQSETIRRKVWEWYQSTVLTRLQKNASLIVIQTRWHVDDLTGRLLAAEQAGGARWRKLNFKAIGDDGSALCPDLHPLAELRETETALGSYYWSALYQQSPVPEGGLFFKHDDINQIVDLEPLKPTKIVRYWDTAASAEGDYTVGVLMADGGDGFVYVLDVVRGQWTASARDEHITATMERDAKRWGNRCEQWIEQEAGGAGKTVAEINVMRWAKFGCRCERATKEKSLRARPLQARTEIKQVRLLRAPWNRAYIDELTQCWSGVHDDQADAASGAYNKLVMASGPVVWHSGRGR